MVWPPFVISENQCKVVDGHQMQGLLETMRFPSLFLPRRNFVPVIQHIVHSMRQNIEMSLTIETEFDKLWPVVCGSFYTLNAFFYDNGL